MDRGRFCPAAGQVKEKRVADLHCQPRLIAAFRRLDLEHIYGAELLAQDRRTIDRKVAIERLEAPRDQGARPHCCRRAPQLTHTSRAAPRRGLTPAHPNYPPAWPSPLHSGER